jgi:hypothetical protein
VSASKRKGDAFERAVAVVFREHGHPYAERMLGLGRHRDDGDIAGVPGFHIECKDCATHRLAEWLDEATIEADIHRVPVVIVKRAGKPIERAYVVMELHEFAKLIADERRNGIGGLT